MPGSDRRSPASGTPFGGAVAFTQQLVPELMPNDLLHDASARMIDTNGEVTVLVMQWSASCVGCWRRLKVQLCQDKPLHTNPPASTYPLLTEKLHRVVEARDLGLRLCLHSQGAPEHNATGGKRPTQQQARSQSLGLHKSQTLEFVSTVAQHWFITS